MTQNFDLTRGYFGDARQVQLPDVFPPFLFREVPRHHGVVACEGSMFKSKFANALTDDDDRLARHRRGAKTGSRSATAPRPGRWTA